MRGTLRMVAPPSTSQAPVAELPAQAPGPGFAELLAAGQPAVPMPVAGAADRLPARKRQILPAGRDDGPAIAAPPAGLVPPIPLLPVSMAPVPPPTAAVAATVAVPATEAPAGGGTPGIDRAAAQRPGEPLAAPPEPDGEPAPATPPTPPTPPTPGSAHRTTVAAAGARPDGLLAVAWAGARPGARAEAHGAVAPGETTGAAGLAERPERPAGKDVAAAGRPPADPPRGDVPPAAAEWRPVPAAALPAVDPGLSPPLAMARHLAPGLPGPAQVPASWVAPAPFVRAATEAAPGPDGSRDGGLRAAPLDAGRLHLQVESPETGRLDLDLRFDGTGGAQLVVQTDSIAREQALAERAGQLVDAMRDLGLQVQVDVRHGGGQGGASGEAAGGQPQGGGAGRSPRPHRVPDAPADSAPPAWPVDRRTAPPDGRALHLYA